MSATAMPRLPDMRAPAGLGIVALVAGLAVLSVVWEGSVGTPLAEPGTRHWLGTDPVGRDLVPALMGAASTTLPLALFGTIVCLFVGMPVGVALSRSGSAAGQAQHPVALLTPALLIGLVVSGLGASGYLTLLASIALPGFVLVAISTRDVLAPLWRQDFVTSARLAGLGTLSAAQRHVLPRLLPRLAANACELLAAVVLIEVSLSFAGLGVRPPGTSLGLLLREGQQFVTVRPLLVIMPGVVVVVLVLGLLLAAAGLRGRGR